jgi:hypothetical protein
VGQATPYQPPAPDLEHDVYIVTDRDLTLYRAVPSGLAQVRTVTLQQDATVGLGASQEGLLLWRDGDWFGYSPDLEPIKHLPLGESLTYAEYHVASSSRAIIPDLGGQVGLVGPDLKVGPTLQLPGFADDIIIDDNIAYILDPTMNKHYLVKVGLGDAEAATQAFRGAPKLLDQVPFYEGPQSKGTHWLDAQATQWLVLMVDQLLIFDAANLQKPPASIPCRQQFDMNRLDGGGPFRVWKAINQSPLWALGHDSGLAVARLEVTPGGLATVQRLPLTPSKTPLMSPPFIERAGSRLYASDGGNLWIIDISGPEPRLVETLPFRYGLHLVPVLRRS